MPAGRPSKIEAFLEVAEGVLFQEDLMLLTDEELVFVINERLPEEDQITDRTFQNWKSGEVKDEFSAQFFRVMKRALILQKQSLFNKFGNDDKAWTRWAWIIERKFSEWNLKHISENKNDNNNKSTLNINMNKDGLDDLKDIVE